MILDRLQVTEARHVLLHVAQDAQGLRTAVSTMYARNETHQMVTAERVVRGIDSLIDELRGLRRELDPESKMEA